MSYINWDGDGWCLGRCICSGAWLFISPGFFTTGEVVLQNCGQGESSETGLEGSGVNICLSL